MIDPAKLFADDLEFAEHRIMTVGQLAPMFSIHFETKDGQNGCAAVIGDFASYEAKMESVNIVRIVGVAMDAYAISLMTEAWVATVNPKMDDAIKNLAPADRMDREEIVMVTMSVRDKPTLFSARVIQRNPDGSVARLAPDTADDHTGFDGRMANLLPKRRPTKREIEQAHSLLRLFGVKLETLQRH